MSYMNSPQIDHRDIVNKIKTMDSQRRCINNLLKGISEKATPISTAIKDLQYDSRVDCCPTWTMLKRFV
jgi:hypothetical protein